MNVSFFLCPHSHSCHYVVTLRYKPRGAGAGCWQLSILQTTQSSITVLRSASISTHSIRRHQSTLFMHKSTYAHSWPEHMQVWIYNRSHGTPAYITSYSSGNLCSFKKHWLVSMLFLNIIYSSNHIFTKVYFAIHSTIILTDSNALVRWLWITGGAGLVLLGLVQWFVWIWAWGLKTQSQTGGAIWVDQLLSWSQDKWEGFLQKGQILTLLHHDFMNRKNWRYFWKKKEKKKISHSKLTVGMKVCLRIFRRRELIRTGLEWDKVNDLIIWFNC